MGYQLIFWQQDPVDHTEASNVYDALMSSARVDRLVRLPLPQILSALQSEFVGDPVPTADGPRPAFWEDGDTVVEFWWSEVHLGAELRGSWPDEIANRVIDVLAGFRVPLYDPQTGERFDSWLAG